MPYFRKLKKVFIFLFFFFLIFKIDYYVRNFNSTTKLEKRDYAKNHTDLSINELKLEPHLLPTMTNSFLNDLVKKQIRKTTQSGVKSVLFPALFKPEASKGQFKEIKKDNINSEDNNYQSSKNKIDGLTVKEDLVNISSNKTKPVKKPIHIKKTTSEKDSKNKIISAANTQNGTIDVRKPIANKLSFLMNEYSKKLALKNKIKQHLSINKKTVTPTNTIKLSHVIDKTEISLNAEEIQIIKDKIRQINDEQYVRNEWKFGSLQSDDIVIIIQVHNRLSNLKYLVESLEEAKHIEDTLVIFSHDFWNDYINNYVQSISSFRTMQMFFPLAIQLNPRAFPGRDPRDCAWNATPPHTPTNPKSPKPETGTRPALSSRCLNSAWPDSYGHYREAAFTQIKHHWWWKFQKIFQQTRVMQNFTGHVLFLEEDHYVLPDVLYMLRAINEEQQSLLKGHPVIALGNYNLKSIPATASVVDRGDWAVNKYNMGFALNRHVFDVIKSCSDSFCLYDDYNWDWTLAYLVKQPCSRGLLTMIATRLSRVLHIGSCGTHIKRPNCNLNSIVSSAKLKIRSLSRKLFPLSLGFEKAIKPAVKPKKSNGGWGDLRDRELCKAIASNAIGDNDILDFFVKNLQMPYKKPLTESNRQVNDNE